MPFSPSRLIHYKHLRIIVPVLLCVLSGFILGNTASVKPIPRKVLILYDSKADQSQKENIIFQNAQLILNYYGLLTEYIDINTRPLPRETDMAGFRGVITTFKTDIQTDPAGYLEWLMQQIEAKRKILIIGRIGVKPDPEKHPKLTEMIHQTFGALGFELTDDKTVSQALLQFVEKNREGTAFERPYPAYPKAYEKINTLGSPVKVYVSLRRIDRSDSTSPMVFTSAVGGYAHEDYIFWEDPITFKRKWYINPFLFFKEALSVEQMPIPDPTTLNGLRIGFSHIDGDGFSGPSRIDKKANCAQIVKDHVLKKYNFPVSVSVIVGEIDPKATGNPELVKLAKEIYRLPNVEPASHTYSHPFYWDSYDGKEARKYQHQYGIKIAGYAHDPEMEIDYSLKYITEELSPPGKPCKLLLWSGNCIPTENDLARVDRLGSLNMNGGDTMFDALNDSYTSVAPYYRKVGSRIQIHTGQANENILTHMWTGPYYGYRNIIETMKRTETPRRVSPLDIYYHFYSGEYPSSLKAVQEVYEWALAQKIFRVYASQYVEVVKGYLTAEIFQDSSGSYLIRNYGNCLTIRFDDKHLVPDMARSVNVLGYSVSPQGLYVSLAPSKKEARIVFSESRRSSEKASEEPYVQTSTGQIPAFEKKQNLIRINYKGFGKGELKIAGLAANKVHALSGNGLNHSGVFLNSDGKGVLTITGVKTGSIIITW